MKKIVKLIIKGDEKTIETIKLAANIALSSAKGINPNFEYEWDDGGYVDNVGGHHDSGVGWMPNGHYCGECTTSSCENCSIWEWELKKQANKGE